MDKSRQGLVYEAHSNFGWLLGGSQRKDGEDVKPLLACTYQIWNHLIILFIGEYNG